MVRRSSKRTSRMLGRIATSRRRRACLRLGRVSLGWGLLCCTPHGWVCGGPVAAFVARTATDVKSAFDTHEIRCNELVC